MIAAILLAPVPALAQSLSGQKTDKPADKQTGPKDYAPMQKVQVKGSAGDYDPRRDDTATKTVLSREEITKYGDNNIYDVLKRAPGVAVTGNTIRMRGLGAGYTQILVNGDRPPPGFSLDALTPDQIERIEIMRAPSAEYSMQAIAGTINIVLRKVVAKRQRDASVSAANSPQARSAFFGGTWADRVGSLSYFLNGSLYAGHNHVWLRDADQFNVPSGEVLRSRESTAEWGGAYGGVALYPRLSWKLASGDELNLSGTAQATRPDFRSVSNTTNLVGSFPSPEWVHSTVTTPGSQLVAAGTLGWISKPAGGKLDLSLSIDRSRRHNGQYSEQYTADRTLRLQRDWDTTTLARRYAMRGKFARSLFDGHSLVTGVGGSVQTTGEARNRVEQLGNAAPIRIIEYFEPRITRAAGFIQDEWSINKQLSMYLGARWEGVQTDSHGAGLTRTRSRNNVTSPVLQALYKLPGQSGRQLRLALTTTYKAPTVDQLTAKRNESSLNTQFAPDWSGNPALRSELAQGIDLGYEHFWAEGAMLSVSGSSRSITNYIRTLLIQDDQGKWLYQPVNDGTAQVRSLEAEIKLPLKQVSTAAAGFDLRASVSRNWSHVASVPGPNNRLDAQVPLSATVGIDYKKGALSAGTSLAYRRGGWVRMSEAQSRLQQSRRDMDAYALWKLDAHYQVRLSLSNLWRAGNWSENLYEDASGVARERHSEPGVVRTGVSVEMKF